jgi:circadian clock protein KaiB
MNTTSEDESRSESFVFQLFVAGDEAHSRAATDNLRRLCESHIDGRCEIQIVDVFKGFDIALENGIFLTPALIKVSPLPRATIFGDLSNTKELLTALQLTRDA